MRCGSSGAIELAHGQLDRRRRSRQQEYRHAADHARLCARQHRRRADLPERKHSEQLAETWEPLLEERAHRLGRPIARRQPGSAGYEDGVGDLWARQRRHAARASPPDPRPARAPRPLRSPPRSTSRRRSRPPSLVAGVRLSEAVTSATRIAAGSATSPCALRAGRLALGHGGQTSERQQPGDQPAGAETDEAERRSPPAARRQPSDRAGEQHAGQQGAIRKLTVPIPLVIIQRGACASCQSLKTIATPEQPAEHERPDRQHHIGRQRAGTPC